MASSGGGKIKSKRPRGAKKPYQRPKSIFSQVTETVSGLVVPSWLKNMWSGHAEHEPEEEPTAPTSPEFDPDVPSTSYGTGYPPNQRQLLQDPDEGTPNTGSFSTIRQREGHEPKGIRNQTSQNTPLPFSAYTHPIQTSTPVENEFLPPHRDVKISERDDDTDSSVSTSGCSSLLPHVDRADHKEKLAQSNLDQLSERSQSSHNTPSRMSLWSDTNTFNTSQSYRGARQSESKPQPAAKRPRFNASYFGTPRQITTPVTGEKHKSAFYPGRTTFGGSSFYRSPAKKQYNPSPYQVHLPVRRHIRPKPAAHSTMDPDFGVTSNTAMKILNTLDRMSTPLSDAKRIPLTPTPSPFAFNRRRSFLPEKKTGGPPVSGIQVGGQARVMSNVQPPVPASSASMSTDSADKAPSTSQNLTTSNQESVTRIQKPSVTFSNTDTSKSTLSQVRAVPGSPPKSGGKMKSKSRNSLHYSASREEDEIVEVPDLPEVALPISSNAMPSFNFGGLKSNSSVTKTPIPVSTVNGSPTLHLDKPIVENEVKALPGVTSTPDWTVSSLTKDKTIPKSVNTSPVSKPLMTSTPFPGTKPAAQFQFSSSIGKSDGSEFKFSVPAVKSSTADDALPTASAGEFTFSAPEVKESSIKVSSGFSFTKPVHVKEDTPKEETDDEPSSGGIKVATTLKSGSCLQALGLTSSQAKSSSATVTSVTTTGSLSLMDKFKPAPRSWECKICCITNEKEKLKCVACQSEKPKEIEPSNTLQSSSGFSLADKFKPEAGSWECGTCLVRNKADKTKCEACQTSKPSPVGGSDSVTATSTDNEVLTFGDKFKPVAGSWECDTCMVQNSSSSTNCAACQTKKPGAPPSSSGGFGFGDKFKPPSGSWTCDTCLVRNQATDSKCLACQTSKPSSSQVSSNSGGFSIPESVLTTNKSSQILFGSKTVSDESTLKSDSSNKPSLSDLFKVESGTWECDTCMVQNKPFSARCAACETPKPGSQPTLSAPPASSFKFGSSVTSSESATSSSSGGFKFDGAIPSLSSGTTSSLGGFQFNSGAKSETAKGSSGGVTIPTSLQGFSFSFPKKSSLDGSATSQASTVAVSSSVGFSLGVSQDSNPSGGISLEFPKGSETSTEGSKVTDNVKPLSIGFTFGDKTEEASSKKTLAFTFGASSTSSTPQTTSTGTPDFAVGSTEATDKGVVSTSHKPLGFQFGSNSNVTLSSNQVAPNASPFQSSAPTSTDSKPAGGSLGVNPLLTASTRSAPVANQSSTSSFLATTVASKKSEPSAMSTTFQFGANLNSASSSSSQSAVQPGKRKEAEPSSTSTDNEGFKPTFNFVGANPTPSSVSFGSTATKEQQSVPLFGATDKATLGNQQKNASPFQFGVASTSSNTATVNKSLFTFGSSSQQSQAPSSNTSGFQFGAVSSSSQNSQPADNKPFTFGAPPTSMQSSVGSFAASKTVTGFDAAGTASNTSEVPSFGGFGTNAVASNTSGSIFGNAQPQQNTAPAFGQGGTLQNSFGTAANSVPAFGSSNPSPAFGSSTSGFGSSNPVNTNNSGVQSETKSLGFQFGQSNNNNPSTGVFQFSGASNPQPTNNSQQGFNFNANQPPSFNFGAAPASAQSTFQFGASQPNSTNPFSATAVTSGRKIKRAVRRTGKKT